MNSGSLLMMAPARAEQSIAAYEKVMASVSVSEVSEIEKQVPSFKALLQYGSQESDEKPYGVIDGVAVIPIIGDLTNRPSWYSYYSRGCSMAMARVLIAFASKDKDVKNIMLEFDTFGGDMDGVAECSESILRARQDGKKVVAFVAPNCHSAGYYVACHCDKIILSSGNAFVGSNGVVTGICDKSGLPEIMGVKWYKIATGPSKAVGSFYSPVTEENIASLTEEVTYVGEQFASVIRAGRGIEVKLGEGVMDGSSWHGNRAIALGLADAIATREDVIAALSGSSADFVLLTDPAPGPVTGDCEDDLPMSGIRPEDPAPEVTSAQTVVADKAKKAKSPATTLKGESLMPQNTTAPKTGIQGLLATWFGATEPVVDTAAIAAKDAEIEALKILAADGEAARLSAIKHTFDTIIRAAGPGATTLEAVTEKLSGKSLAQIEEEVGPYLKIADANFDPAPLTAKVEAPAKPVAPVVPVSAGRQTAEPEAPVAPAPGNTEADAEKIKAKAERLARLEREYAQLN